MSSLETRMLVLCSILTTISLGGANVLFGQAGLRESLQRLDSDKDGKIEPDEITPLARPYLEQIASAKRLSLERSNRIEEFQEASRIYHAMRNGVAGKSIRPEPEGTVRPFGAAEDQPLVPEFGLAELKYPYIQEDLDEADRTLRRSDRNDDGYIDRRESMRARWTHLDPFASDLDKDDRLSRLELAQRYARRRLLSDDAGELFQRARRVGNGIERVKSSDRERSNDSSWWRRGGSDYWLTASLLGRFDRNRNGRLENEETVDIGIPLGRIDADRDGEVTREELHGYMTELQDAAGDVTDGLPGWFYELDVDADDQVSMAEFTNEWTEAKILEFDRLDANRDGLLTAREASQAKALTGGTFSNNDAVVLPPSKTIISEIEVDEDFLVGDVDLKLSITHSNTGFLDGYLVGPDGQRIELFTEVGGSGDHFEETRFDDESKYPITKARPPFKGTFLPEGMLKRQPGLSAFNEKSAAGVWQLIVRGTRSDRFGMLHSWSLIFTPIESVEAGISSAPEHDGPVQAEKTIGAVATDSRDASPTQTEEGEPQSAQAVATRKKSAWSYADIERFRQWSESKKAAGEDMSSIKKQFVEMLAQEKQGDGERAKSKKDWTDKERRKDNSRLDKASRKAEWSKFKK